MITKYLETNRKIIDRELDKHLPKKTTRPNVIHNAMRYSVFNGGKRIRPILVLESTKATKGNIKDGLLLACAIELIHTYSLIHDDLPSMDNDDTRRGKPSCHIKYGEAMAILAGDALLTLAFNVMAKIKNKEKAGEIIFEVSKSIGTFGMIGGQVMDLNNKDRGKIDLATMEYINIRKTGSLITTAAKIGAMVSGAKQKEIKALKTYGEYIGLAFQITDDVLDKEGYADILGAEAAREEAATLTKRAKESLDLFGKRADNLRKIADFIIERKT